MVSASDLIHLPYTLDLTEGGIAYACRSLAYPYNRVGGSPFDRLRGVVGRIAVELAFRHYLSEQHIPFDVMGATPFTDPDRYDVSLGGHRCDMKSFLISHRRQICLVHKDPSLVLQVPALVPLDQFAAEGHKEGDIYLFAFLLGLTTPAQEDLQRAIRAKQTVYLIHSLPEEWARPKLWLPLENLALKSECGELVTVEIGGRDAERNFISARLELPPKRRVPVEQVFHSLTYIHAARRPEVRLGLHSPRHGDAYLIQPHEWGNIWIYGTDILLTGYLTHEEFHHKAHVLPVGSRTFQYDRTRTKNLAVPVAELHPLNGLFDKVRAWEGSKKI